MVTPGTPPPRSSHCVPPVGTMASTSSASTARSPRSRPLPPGERDAALADLLRACSADEGRYAVKLVTGEMRIGLREGLVEEAISVAFERPATEVARAVMLLGDLGEVACLVARGERVDRPRYFSPLRFMLASPVADAQEAVRRMGDEVWVEDKYDGIRCQLHRSGDRVALYSRDLNEVTEQFPEVAEAAAAHSDDVILDGEVLAFRDGRVLPFHDLQSRLGRRNPSAAVRAGVPVIYVAWDLLLHAGDSLLDTPLRDRRRRLEELSLGDGFALAHLEPAVGSAAVDERFAAARARRNEGLMLKDPDSAYTPGRRGLAWLKLKRPLDTLDVVVVGAEWGHGKRRGVLSDVTFAVRTGDGRAGHRRQGVHRPHRCRDRRDDRSAARHHCRGPRPLPHGASADRARGGVRRRAALRHVTAPGTRCAFHGSRDGATTSLSRRSTPSSESPPSRTARRTIASSSSTPQGSRVSRAAGGREQLGRVQGGVAHLLEAAEACAQRRVLRRQRGVAVGLGGIPRVQVPDLSNAGLEHLLEAPEARLCRRGQRGAQGLLSKPRRREDGVLLGMHADADVIGTTAERGRWYRAANSGGSRPRCSWACRTVCRCNRCSPPCPHG